MEIVRNEGEAWKVGAQFEGWLVGLLAYGEKFSRLSMLERHNQTEEAFVLVKGEATLYTADKDIKITEYKMEQGTLYNVGKGEWHHIVVSKDALVVVVENSNTAKENSDYIFLA
ncbi:MAG: cupin domain-containing protein [Ruminococcaceae bacterium]|nr:cupin domain-containing protein [Oscillospiraceae bacterium]